MPEDGDFEKFIPDSRVRYIEYELSGQDLYIDTTINK